MSRDNISDQCLENIFEQIDKSTTHNERIKHIINANKRYKTLADRHNNLCKMLQDNKGTKLDINNIDDIISSIETIQNRIESSSDLETMITDYIELRSHIELLEKHIETASNRIHKVYSENKKIKLETIKLEQL